LFDIYRSIKKLTLVFSWLWNKSANQKD